MERVTKTFKITEDTDKLIKRISKAYAIPESYVIDNALRNYYNNPEVLDMLIKESNKEIKKQIENEK